MLDVLHLCRLVLMYVVYAPFISRIICDRLPNGVSNIGQQTIDMYYRCISPG